MEILTALIAVLAVWIAYQQWITNSLRLRHELYERRMSLYKTILNVINSSSNANKNTVDVLHDVYLESQFLFDSDITNLIDELWNTVNDLSRINEIMTDGHSDLTLKKKWSEHIDTVDGYKDTIHVKISPYLKLSK